MIPKQFPAYLYVSFLSAVPARHSAVAYQSELACPQQSQAKGHREFSDCPIIIPFLQKPKWKPLVVARTSRNPRAYAFTVTKRYTTGRKRRRVSYYMWLHTTVARKRLNRETRFDVGEGKQLLTSGGKAPSGGGTANVHGDRIRTPAEKA